MGSSTSSWHGILWAVQLSQPTQKACGIYGGGGSPPAPAGTWWSSNNMLTPPRLATAAPTQIGDMAKLPRALSQWICRDFVHCQTMRWEIWHKGCQCLHWKLTEICLQECPLSFSSVFSWESMFYLGWGFSGVRDLCLWYTTDLQWECNHMLHFKFSILQVFYNNWI